MERPCGSWRSVHRQHVIAVVEDSFAIYVMDDKPYMWPLGVTVDRQETAMLIRDLLNQQAHEVVQLVDSSE